MGGKVSGGAVLQSHNRGIWCGEACCGGGRGGG